MTNNDDDNTAKQDKPHPPDRGCIRGDLFLVSPKEGMKSVLVYLLEESNVLTCFSHHIWTHAGHAQSKLTGQLKVITEKVVKNFHMCFLLEENMIGQVLQDLDKYSETGSSAL